MNILSVWRPEDYSNKLEFIRTIAARQRCAVLDAQMCEMDFLIGERIKIKYMNITSRYFESKTRSLNILPDWPGTTWISDLLHLINTVDEQIVFIHDYDDILHRVFNQMYHKHLKWNDIERWDVLDSKVVYFFIKARKFDGSNDKPNKSLTPFSINANDGLMRGRFNRIDIGWGGNDATNFHAIFNDPLDDD